jgi:ubiquinone/menaquinone biosynthesis C-methylase UbiE
MHERRFDPAQADKLDNPERRKWLPPGKVIERLGLQPGSIVADVGAGTGYFTLRIAEAVGAGGRVFAVDVASEMLERIRVKTESAQVANVSCILGEADATNLTDHSCDVVFMANVWHEFDDHKAVLAEAERILKPTGRLEILDWRADLDSPPGPPQAHRISDSYARAQIVGACFAVHAQDPIGQYS